MTNVILFLLFSICQLGCLIIPIIEKKGDPLRNNTKYTKSDILLIFLSIIGFGFGFFIFLSTQDDEKQKASLESDFKKELSKKLAERDSIHEIKDSILTVYYTLKVDSSYAKSIAASNEALAKYNLTLIDSMNKVTSKINIKSINLPQISLEAASNASSPLYISNINDEAYLNIKFVSINNISYNSRIECCIIDLKELPNNISSYTVVDCRLLFENRKIFLPDRFTTLRIKANPSWNFIERPIIIFSGQFSSDAENKNIKDYFQAYEFNFKTQRMGSELVGSMLDNLKSFLKNRSFIK